jgi:hypothetical protein
MIHDVRSLPVAVLERLGIADVGSDPLPGVDLVRQFRGRPYRMEERLHPIEVRSTEDGDPIIEGYASSTEVAYDVWGGPPYGWSETIARGAFDRALQRGDDTRLLVNHEGIPLARTRSNTLTLSEDAIGLRIETPNGVDLGSPNTQTLVSAMRRGDIDQMSMAFMIDTDDNGMRMEQWNSDYTERRITGVVLFDVSVVTYPANPATAAVLRTDESVSERRGLPLVLARAYAEIARY